jgi:phosphatidylethanolamine/phosphatidyl-N-methylethanolamine N-methyltransferase
MRILFNLRSTIPYDPDFQDNWYRNYYSRVNVTAIKGSFFGWVLHRSIEIGAGSNQNSHILEIGTNSGEHIKYVSDGWRIEGSYTACDIRVPSSDSLSYFHGQSVNFVEASIENLPFEDNTFDRIVLTCVLHHVNEIEKSLFEIRRVLKPGGFISILLPNDPGFAYRLSRALTTLPLAIYKGVFREVQLNHALEHKNNFLSLIRTIKYVFGKDEVKIMGWPFFVSSYSLNVFTTLKVIKDTGL